MRSIPFLAAFVLVASAGAHAQNPKPKDKAGELTFPPKLPDGKAFVSDTSADFLKPPASLREGVAVAKAAPTVDFLYFPGQDYPGKPWSCWGDSLFANGKYYTSIGDHLAVNAKAAAPNGTGTARVFEYDPEKKALRQLVDTATLLKLPTGHYAPGKIHSRIDLGGDGWLYFSTHRGSTTVTTDKNHYEGDWILRCDPKSGKAEVVSHAPVPKHCIPTSFVDPERLIFYGGTAPGTDAQDQGVRFFAYDLKAKKMLHTGPDGPARCMMFAKSTGRIYYTPGKEDGEANLVRFDPAKPGPPTALDTKLGMRAASAETPQGIIYTVSRGQKAEDADVFAFDTRTEKAERVGPAAVGAMTYVTSVDADPTGRYLYYIPGAHGGSDRDGTAVVQFDTKTKQRKVIAFLHPFYKDRYGVSLVGTYACALDDRGERLFVTWNANRGTKAWDCCAMTVIHIPASERPVENR